MNAFATALIRIPSAEEFSAALTRLFPSAGVEIVGVDRFFTLAGGRLGARLKLCETASVPHRAGAFLYCAEGAKECEESRALSDLGWSLLAYPNDARLPFLAHWEERGASVQSWRPGRRAVYRWQRGVDSEYVKVLRPADLGAMQKLFNQCGERLKSAGVVVPQEIEAASSSLIFPAARGVPLHDRIKTRTGLDLESLAQSLAGFRDRCRILTYRPSCRAFAVEDELFVVQKFLRLAARVEPRTAARVESAYRRLDSTAARRERWSMLHRDLHDKQIFLDGASVSFIDVDTLAMGPLALDPCNLAAHLILRELQGWCASGKALARQWLAANARHTVGRESLRFFLCTSLLRLCCVYLLRPLEVRVALAMLEHAEPLLASADPEGFLP